MKNLFSLVSFFFFSFSVAQAETVSLGVIIPMSGPYAHFGEAGRIGLEMALAASPAKIHLLYEDSQYEAPQALSAYMKLVDSSHAKAIIVLGSPPASAIIPLQSRNDCSAY